MNAEIKKLMQEVSFDETLFAEKITYNGVEMAALIRIGESEQQNSPGFMRKYKSVVVQGEGTITVNADVVPNPQRGDLIVYEGKKYYVAGIADIDSPGGQINLKVTSNARGYLNL